MNNLFQINGNDLIKYNADIDWYGKYFDSFPNSSQLKISAGIYAFVLCNEIVYIGSSINLFNRLRTHVMNIQCGHKCNTQRIGERKYYYFNKYITDMQYMLLQVYDKNISKLELEAHEYKHIQMHNPIFNVQYRGQRRIWNGTDQDIDNFVNGIVTIDELKRRYTYDTAQKRIT